MPMFSVNQSSCESRLKQLLQDNFFRTSWRNKAIAKWAAGRLGYKGDKVNSYVRSFVFSYLLAPNDKKMVGRILADFKNERISITEDEIINKIKSVEERMKSKVLVLDNVNESYL